MQVKKDIIKEKIISSARREFLEKGYIKASLRVIAEKEGLTKGAVYSYFKNKDALFCDLTAPAVNFIERAFQQNNNYDNNVLFKSYEITVNNFKRCAQTILDNYESFKLLLFCSAGSSLENYRERIIQLYAQKFKEFFPLSTHIKLCNESIISEMFIHTLANTYISFLEEIILHEPEREEIDDYVMQIAIFVHSGIEKLYLHQIKEER
jgi:AcrR family transcriptional regulator